ncbi:protein of unknown function [Fodinibius roseus]|uniref:DUF4296 domain-containing protein n=1 Tax=Fodinibius roseus TaxID=1194090 RepID=A0A1M4XEG5_9BACT|nr:DUF4296 domain-containing protein [Fodinibius roseus]SHE91818.1 protein of unknown function [Fodinibius roseus]
MVRWYCLVILLSGLVAGCSESPEKPEMLIDEDTYISLLVELQLVRTYSETDRMDEAAADSLRDTIFREYGVPDSAFWESHKYYQQFPADQKKRVEEAIERLRKDRMEEPGRPSEEQD